MIKAIFRSVESYLMYYLVQLANLPNQLDLISVSVKLYHDRDYGDYGK